MSDNLSISADGAVTVVTLGRPDVLNALDAATIDELTQLFERGLDTGVRCLVLTGSGRAFCAGADLKSARTPGGVRGLRDGYNPMMLAVAALDVPVVAAVNGVAAGSGLSLACAADIRIASTQSAFVPSFSTIGLVPDAGATYFVPRLVGHSRAFWWLAGGQRWDAGEALRHGLVDEVVDHDRLTERTLEAAHELANRPGAAVALTKRALASAARRHLAEQLELEADLQQQALAAPGRAQARADMTERLAGGAGEAEERNDDDATR